MKTKHRILSMLLIFCMLAGIIAMLAMNVSAASGDVTDARFVAKGTYGELHWSSVEGATSYGVTVHLASDDSEIARTSTTENFVSAEFIDAEGEFYFSVVALNGYMPMGKGATSKSFVYPMLVQVGDVNLKHGEYTTDGKTKTSGTPSSAGYAYLFDGVLTLNSFEFEGLGENSSIIYTENDLKIEVLGKNNLSASAPYNSLAQAIYTKADCEIYGSGTLNIEMSTANSSEDTFGIRGFGDLTLTLKNITLNIFSDSHSYGIYNVYGGNSAVFENATVNINTEDNCIKVSQLTATYSKITAVSKKDTAVQCVNGITFENCDVHAKGMYGLATNSGYQINIGRGYYVLEGYTSYGAMWVENSNLVLPSMDYKWCTETDGMYLYYHNNGFEYAEQPYIEITTGLPGVCICTDRCYFDDVDINCLTCAPSMSDVASHCMGTPELQLNGAVYRLSDREAEIGIMADVNRNALWRYYYTVTDDSSAQPTAEEILEKGESGYFDSPHTLTVNDLTSGEKYIHILLRQEDQDRTTNILRLTIEEFVELTMTPSAEGGIYDKATKTLMLEGGGEVTFTLNMPAYVHCESDEAIEVLPVGDGFENATEWKVTLPEAVESYTFYCSLGGQTARCTVEVVEPHKHSYSTDWSSDAEGHWHACECGEASDFASHTSGGAATAEKAESCTVCGYEIAPKLSGIHTVTLNAIGGTISPATAEVKSGTTIADMNKNHKPVRSDYEFVGWSLEDDGLADNGDNKIEEDCTLYAVWQQYSPSYDDDYYDPPPADIPVTIGGDYDAILQDGVVIVRGDKPISGTLDLGKTNAEAIRLPADALSASTGEDNTVTIKYPGGTAATVTGYGLAAAERELEEGEDLQLAVKKVGSETLPKSLRNSIKGGSSTFIAAVEADVKAVRVGGSTRNIEILADQSDAVTWSTTVEWHGDTQGIVDNLRAYKVLEDGSLEAKAAKVTVNDDGTLTCSALSNGNSTYVFLLEPEEATEPDGLSMAVIVAIVIACVAVLAGGGAAIYLFVLKRKKKSV